MIYFVRTCPNGTIKIGSTGNLPVRLRSLAYAYQSEVELLHSYPGEWLDEKAAHGRFRHLRIGNTEQFKPGDDLMDFLGLPPVQGWEKVEPSRQISSLYLKLDINLIEALDELMESHEMPNRAKMVCHLILKGRRAVRTKKYRERRKKPLDSVSTAS